MVVGEGGRVGNSEMGKVKRERKCRNGRGKGVVELKGARKENL